MIYNLYVFDRKCNCIFTEKWNRGANSSTQPPTTGSLSGTSTMPFIEEAKLIYGVIFSLRNYMSKTSLDVNPDNFISYKTDSYKLVYYQTPSFYKYCVLAGVDDDTSKLREILKSVHLNYIEFIHKSPLEQLEGYISSVPFIDSINKLVKIL